MTEFCQNWLCETEATHYYVTDKNERFYLCWACKDAFEIGQVNPDKGTISVEEDE